VAPVALAAREVAADRAVLAAPAVVALAAGVTIFEAVVALAVLAALVVRAAPAVPVALAVPAGAVVLVAPAGAVGSVPVGAETPLVRSASRAVGRLEVESPSAPSVKSSTTWRPRRSAAFGCRGVPVRWCGFHAVRP